MEVSGSTGLRTSVGSYQLINGNCLTTRICTLKTSLLTVAL